MHRLFNMTFVIPISNKTGQNIAQIQANEILDRPKTWPEAYEAATKKVESYTKILKCTVQLVQVGEIWDVKS